MPQPKNMLARVVVPLIVAVAGIGVIVAIYKGSASGSGGAPSPAAPLQPAPQGPSPQAPTASPPAQPTDATPAPASAGETLSGLHARVLSGDPGASGFVPLGGIDRGGPAKMRLIFSPTGAGVAALDLAEHFESIKEDRHVRLQSEHADALGNGVTPLALLGVEVAQPGREPEFVPVAGNAASPVWRQTAPGAFEALVVDAQDRPALRIERVYSLTPGGYTFTIRQRAENLTASPLKVRWFQFGPADLPEEGATYGGEKRKVRFGYLLPPARDPSQRNVVSSDFLIPRTNALGSKVNGVYLHPADRFPAPPDAQPPLWPSEKSAAEGYALAWTGVTSRYFAAAIYPAIDPAAAGGATLTFPWVGLVNRVVLQTPTSDVITLRLDSSPAALAPAGLAGNAADFSHSVYAGPLDRSVITSDPGAAALGLTGLIVYNFGGMCGFCTFGWMTALLLGLLHFLHDTIFRDWALAIVFLVVIVRTILHPVTRWSQIRLARFGKQMQGIAPKQKEIQEKYRDDQARLRQETARLWREEGISPAGMLGCLPAFLQMPVWIALYATLFFAVELRHQPAFYGLFQAVQAPSWPTWRFLGDLSEPDRLFYFGDSRVFHVPLMGEVASINLLPLILAVVFFIQQKYLTPPPTSTLSPEQELQQKMMKWMMVIMFPLFMYNAPSGLAIYFICNSTLAIAESKYIRSHMDQKGLLDLDRMRADRNARRAKAGPSFMDRFQKVLEQRAKQVEQRRK